MELSKRSELNLGASVYVVSTELAGETTPSIETKVVGGDGSLVFRTSQDISALRPIFQNSEEVFARLEDQHATVLGDLEKGRLTGKDEAPAAGETPAASASSDETLALGRAVKLLGAQSYSEAATALREVLGSHPNCSEARELLEVAYKASSDARLPLDLHACLKKGTEAFAAGRQREAIESWKQCLVEEPDNRRLQLLVLLSTTWSSERRRAYTREVLAHDNLHGGRPEEAQALLLLAQTADDADAPTVSVPSPFAASDAAPAGDAPGADDFEIEFPTIQQASTASSSPSLESPKPRAPAPAPAARPPAMTIAMPSELATGESPPSRASATVSSSPPAPASRTSSPAQRPTPRPPMPPAPTRKEAPAPTPGGTGAANEAGAEPEPGSRQAEPALEAPRSAPTPRGARRPMGRARRSSPAPLYGGIAAAVVLVGLAAVYLLMPGSSVPAERLAEADSYLRAGQYSAATSAYDAILSEFGDHPEIFLGRGRARVAGGSMEQGLSDLTRAYEMSGEASIAEEIADLYYSTNRFPEAIELYGEAFASASGSAEARYRMAVSLVQRRRGDEALDHLRAGIALDPSHGEAQFLFGQLLNERGRHGEAEAALRAAESSVGRSSDFLSHMGIALLEQDKLDQAEEIARAFRLAYPSDPRSHSILGEVYLSRGQYEPARAALIQALRTDRSEPRAQIALGRTWLAIGRSRGDAGDLAKARQVLSEAQGVDEAKRLLALGEVAVAQGDYEAAELWLRESLGKGAPGLAAHLALAEARARSDDLVGAAEEMQRASAFASEDPAIPLSLAILYSQLEESDRTMASYLQAVRGAGLVAPSVDERGGPVVLPAPYVPLPPRFDVNRSIRLSYEAVLSERPDDPAAAELKRLAESTSFLLAQS